MTSSALVGGDGVQLLLSINVRKSSMENIVRRGGRCRAILCVRGDADFPIASLSFAAPGEGWRCCGQLVRQGQTTG